MKKQYKTYLLLAVVLLVWGLIGFRIVKAINPSNEKEKPNFEIKEFAYKKVIKKKAFFVKADYRDPFLGTYPKKKSKKRVYKKQVVENWPSIEFLGTMGDKNGRNNMYFVSINGKQELMQVPQKIGEVKLISGTKKQIKVSYKGKRKSILLKK